jgi:hypothetical protein
MNLENNLLERFQVEELEKRYEFSWIDEVKVTAAVPIENATLTVSVTIPVNQ